MTIIFIPFYYKVFVDADTKFIAVDVGYYGQNSDSSIFGASHFGQPLYQNRLNCQWVNRTNTIYHMYLLMMKRSSDDEISYPLTLDLMRPFPKTALICEERIYSYRHSRACHIIEYVFGILAKKFQVIETTMLVTPETA